MHTNHGSVDVVGVSGVGGVGGPFHHGPLTHQPHHQPVIHAPLHTTHTHVIPTHHSAIGSHGSSISSHTASHISAHPSSHHPPAHQPLYHHNASTGPQTAHPFLHPSLHTQPNHAYTDCWPIPHSHSQTIPHPHVGGDIVISTSQLPTPTLHTSHTNHTITNVSGDSVSHAHARAVDFHAGTSKSQWEMSVHPQVNVIGGSGQPTVAQVQGSFNATNGHHELSLQGGTTFVQGHPTNNNVGVGYTYKW